MASKETKITEQEVVAMRTRSRHPMDAENIETLLTKLENNPDNVKPHEQYQSHQYDQATEVSDDEYLINELEASVQQLEREVEMTKARALRYVRAQRKKELLERMERYQEEIEYYQKVESSVRCEVPPVPSWSSPKEKQEHVLPTSAEEFLPKRLQASNKRTEEWCKHGEEDDGSVSSIYSMHSGVKATSINRSTERVLRPTTTKATATEVKSANYANYETKTTTNTDVKPETYYNQTEPASTDTMEKILSKLVSQQKENALPKSELNIFDGSDLLDFPVFMRNFKYVVLENTQDPVRRLEMLLRFTQKEPHELIKNCITIDPPDVGYNRAVYLLNRDYAQPALLATAYKTKAEHWPRIKAGDRVGLTKFYVFVTSIQSAKMANKELETTDGYEFLRTLAGKLPTPLQQKWIREVGKNRERQQDLTLQDFEEFVGRLARDENDPRIAGLGYQARSQYKVTEQSRKSTHAFATTVTATADRNMDKTQRTSVHTSKKYLTTASQRKNLAERWPCLYCEGPRHALADCRKFSSLKAAEKSEHCKRRGLCYGCLNPGHIKKSCPNPEWAKCKKCQRAHATALHDDERLPRKQDENGVKNENMPTAVTTGYVNITKKSNTNPKMAIIPVLMKPNSSETCIATYAFLDHGCGAVFMKDCLQRALHMQTKNTKLLIKTMNLEEVVRTKMIQGNLQVGNIDGSSFLDLPTVYVKDELPVGRDDIPTQDDIAQWNHLTEANIEIPKLPRNYRQIPDVTMMIGMNVPGASAPHEVVLGNVGEPYAQRSQLGWIIYGLPGKPNQQEIKINFCRVDNSADLEVMNGTKQLEQQFRQYVNMEFNERLTEEKGLSTEDKEFMRIMNESVVKVDGHYQTDLPLRRKVQMPDNKIQAEAYANSLKKRLRRDEKQCELYANFMEDLTVKGYAERVPDSELGRNDGRVWYIPHHSVKHPKKPDKVRVVFNCPVVFQNYSLNSELLQGPDLTNRLYGVLLRWRQQPVAITADIESMFHQVRVNPDDCDLLRYLWWPGGNLNMEPKTYRMRVHLFGAVSSPGCANYALRKTAQDTESKYDKEITESVQKDFYVDDFVKSVDSVESGKRTAHDVTKMLQEGGFKLTKWSGNREVLESIPVEHRAKDIKNVDLNHDKFPKQRALGVQWCVESDQLQCRIQHS